MTTYDPELFLGWTAGTRADAERFAREVCAEHGLSRRQVQVTAAPSGWDVHRRTAFALQLDDHLAARRAAFGSYAQRALEGPGA